MTMTLLSLHKLFNKELRINYVRQIQNKYELCEQAFRRYCVNPLVSQDADRWGYTWPSKPTALDKIRWETTFFCRSLGAHVMLPSPVNVDCSVLLSLLRSLASATFPSILIGGGAGRRIPKFKFLMVDFNIEERKG